VYVNFARIQLYTVVGCDFFIIQMTPSWNLDSESGYPD
jgi:hypothetical protein